MAGDQSPKAMSSRLLTMKFMQRAAASSPLSASRSSLQQPSPKRPKIDGHSLLATSSDLDAVNTALAAEEAKRQEALDKQRHEAGETKWAFAFQSGTGESNGVARATALNIASTTIATIDNTNSSLTVTNNSSTEEIQQTQATNGRRSFGRFNRKVEKFQRNVDSTEYSSEQDSDEGRSEAESDAHDSNNDPTRATAAALVRGARNEAVFRDKAAEKAERREERRANKLSESRIAKEKVKPVNLKKLSSISGSGGVMDIDCFNCGALGHKASNCPSASRDQKRKRKKRGDDDGDEVHDKSSLKSQRTSA